MDKTINLLQQVSNIQKKYEEIAAITGENFNVFSILSMERREVKTHSAFLGELLNPKGSHGLKDSFLKLFIKEVFKETLAEFETSSANTITEEYIAQINEDKTKGGRVDIVVKDAKGNVILIENKIDAYEQQNQLIRYRNAYPKAKILFLTLVGYDSNTALQTETNQKDYISISYEEQIVQWLEVCLKEAVNYPMLREAIKQYIYLIKKITNQTSNNQMSQEIIEIMKNNLSSSFEIEKNIKHLKRSLYYEFMEYIKKYASKNEMKINSAWEGKDKRYGLFLQPESWKNSFLQICIIFHLKNYGGLYVGVSYLQELKEDDKDIVRKKFRENGFLENEWWIWKYTTNSNWGDNAEIWDSVANGERSKEYKEIVERIEEILKVYESMSN